MKSAEIKHFAKRIRVKISDKTRDCILADAETALVGSAKNGAEVSGSGPSIWSTIMKSKVTRLTAAAVIIIGVFITIRWFGVSIDGASIAWGDVKAAFLAQPWVHLKYDNGAEEWYDLEKGRHYFKDWDGRCVVVDWALNIKQRYYSVWGQHISESRPVIYKDGVVPPWQPKTAWEAIVGDTEKMAEDASVGHWEFARRVERVDGRRLVRFDRYYNDAVGRRLLVKQLWADPETRLPVKVRERLSLARRNAQNREFITGVFDFPDSGPSNIYDLGVSRDLPIVREYGRTADPRVVEVLEAGKAATERFPTRYRVIRWENDRNSEIDVVWRDGKKVHSQRYFNLADYPEYHLELPTTAEGVLTWTETQPPVSIHIFDGERQYSRRQHPALSGMREPEVRVMRVSTNLLPSSSKPIENQWPYANRKPGSFAWIDDAPEELSSYIGLRIESGDIRRDFYIDPEHDYMCAGWIWWKERSGSWEKEREYELSGFAQLPEGQWYATKEVLIGYPDPETGIGGPEANWNIDVKVLKQDEYPPDTFNGEKLLEGAKKVETY